jgi:ABC-type nitrate/sulfonate/bicarbonate transport system substrate-binding protein
MGGKVPSPLRVGFVPLTDAAPLVVAVEQGFFAAEGLLVSLERQIGWGNVRDKLTFGQLHAAHALIGMPLLSQLRREPFAEPLVAVMNLGTGSDAITISRRLVDAGVTTVAGLAERVQRRVGEVPVIAHVFGCSAHHYLLRAWLAAGGVDPDRDVRLCVRPPAQVGRQLAAGALDGFCCGEPYNTLAALAGHGQLVAVTADVVPSHPDKILAVTGRWAEENPDVVTAMCRAVLRGMQFCDDDRNLPAVAELMARSAYLDQPGEAVHRSLTLLRTFVGPGGARTVGPTDWRGRPFDPKSAFPSVTHHAWYAAQMARWGHLEPAVDGSALAAECVTTGPFRAAAESVGVACPDGDAPGMRLRSGTFTVGRPLLAAG